jgi:glycosyltransferase 2 family protein
MNLARRALRIASWRPLRFGFLLAVLAVLAAWLLRNGPEVQSRLSAVSAPHLVLAAGAALAAVFASLLAWRAVLADLGSRLPLRTAAQVLFIGQLGKYLPGSIWPVVAQMELGLDHGVPRRRSATSLVVFTAVAISTGALVAAVLLPFSSGTAVRRYWWALVVLPAGCVLLHPRVLNQLLNRMLVWARLDPLEHPVSGRGLTIASGWSVVQWILSGLALFFVAQSLGGRGVHLLPLSVGAYALAWIAGYLVVLAPAGGGVREAVLGLALSGSLPSGGALTAALLLRVLMTLADLFVGLLGVGLAGRRRLTRRRVGRAASAGLRTPDTMTRSRRS